MLCKNCGLELQEGSVFCNKCGKKVLLETDFTSSAKKVNRKVISIGIVGILIIGIFVAVFVVFNNPFNKFKGAINDNKYAEASKIYSEKIKGNIESEKEAIEYLKSEIEGIKKSFIENKIEYNNAISKLETLQKTELVTSDISSAISEIKKLNDSRTAFKSGNEFLNSKNYKDAFKEFKKVIKEDENYSKAQEAISSSIKDYKTAVLVDAEDNANRAEYDKAISILNDSLIIIPNDSDISAKKASFEKLNEEKKTTERKKKMEEAKSQQLLIVENSKIAVQDTEYKSLYPDMLQVIVRNNSDKTVKNMDVSFLAYDKNKFPLKIKTEFNISGGDFEFIGIADNVNIVPKASFGNNVGWKLDNSHGIKTVLACVKEVEFYDGSLWTNPYYEYWLEEFKEKPLH
jgi:tetratricopeptide (TPR) repeat protein